MRIDYTEHNAEHILLAARRRRSRGRRPSDIFWCREFDKPEIIERNPRKAIAAATLAYAKIDPLYGTSIWQCAAEMLRRTALVPMVESTFNGVRIVATARMTVGEIETAYRVGIERKVLTDTQDGGT